eukprot:g293.t1
MSVPSLSSSSGGVSGAAGIPLLPVVSRPVVRRGPLAVPGSRPAPKAKLQCKLCKSTVIDKDESSGTTTCTGCGAVLEENCIVSSVQFSETGNGGTAIIGQFVSATCTKPFSGGAGTSGHPFSKESREITINNGRKRISQLAAALRLGQHYVESAHRLFLIAVTRNFVQGRRTANVVAACLYIVCRRNKAPYLLIDFSDVLQTNVYVLGTCFVKFCRMLNVTLPQLDPTLYIHRFASKLDYGRKRHQVAMTAIRLVQRFKRDWIQTGRRPAGICAAALLIAGRMHGFDRSRKSVVSVVRVCEQTLRNRLDEFSCTPTADLTMEEFARIDLPAACDPPSFIAAERNRLMLKAQEQQLLLANGASNDDSAVQEMEVIVNELSETRSNTRTRGKKGKNNGKTSGSSSAIVLAKGKADKKSATAIDAIVRKPMGGRVRVMRQRQQHSATKKKQSEMDEMYSGLFAELTAAEDNDGGGAQALLPVKSRQVKRKTRSSLTKSGSKNGADLSGHIDGDSTKDVNLLDVDSDFDSEDESDQIMILSKTEVAKKKKMWLAMNEEYLQEKKNKEIHEAASGNNGSKGAKGGKNKKKKGSKVDANGRYIAADTATQAVMDMAKVKRLSKKINYEALKSLFPQENSSIKEEIAHDLGKVAPAKNTGVDDAVGEAVYNISEDKNEGSR